jgi:RNase P subunit RPR2
VTVGIMGTSVLIIIIGDGREIMTSWRDDRRFHCPHCDKPIRIVIPSANRVTTSVEAVAVCLSCDRFFEETEWRYQALPRDFGLDRDRDFPY